MTYLVVYYGLKHAHFLPTSVSDAGNILEWMFVIRQITLIFIVINNRYIDIVTTGNDKLDINYLKSYFRNSLMIHEQNIKEITAVKESLYVIKNT